nr:YPDG domain-containing protein [Corynebacterium diphtheriae]
MSRSKNALIRNLSIAAGAAAISVGAAMGPALAVDAAQEAPTADNSPVVEAPQTPEEGEQSAQTSQDNPRYESQIVRAGHSAEAEQVGDVSEDTIFEYSQFDVPEGWFVSVDEDSGKVTVSTPPDAQDGDNYTVKVKAVDLDGNVTWSEVTFTVGDPETDNPEIEPLDADAPEVQLPAAE